MPDQPNIAGYDRPMTDEEVREALGGEEPGPEPEAPNLPAPLAGPDGALDIDALRELTPRLRAGLIDALRHAAGLAREARGTVVTPEDGYPLVRRLTEAGEILRQAAGAFQAGAKEADALIEEEALALMGEQEGALSGSLFVPDGEGQRIAVRADYKPGSSSWDVASLIGWLAEDTVAEEGRKPNPAGTVGWETEEAVELCREAMERLLSLGTYSPGAAKIEALRKKLAGQQRDADAAVLRQLRMVGDRTYQGVKITREEAK